MFEFSGNVAEVIKASNSSGDSGWNNWCRLTVRDGARGQLITGQLRQPVEGDFIVAAGNLRYSKGRGQTLEATQLRREIPTTEVGITTLLASLPGVSSRAAATLFKEGGPTVIDKLLEGKHPVADNQGAFVARKLASRLDDALAFRTMRELGLPAHQASRVVAYLTEVPGGLNARLKANPYAMTEVSGTDFKAVDSFLLLGGIAHSDPRRVGAAAKYALRQASLLGHTCLELNTLLKDLHTLGLGGLTMDALKAAAAPSPGAEPFKLDGDTAAHPALWDAENTICAYIGQLRTQGKTKPKQGKMRPELTEEQREAVTNALGPVSALTGGPGCGKTYTIKSIVEILGASNVLLAAPTGKAAKRVTEATGATAKTLHSLMLGYRKGDSSGTSKTLLIDEASMVSVDLLAEVLQTVKPSRLILVGDADQLPSIGPGRVLNDVILSGAIPVVRLTKVQRQAADSQVVLNAQRIRQGEAISIDPAKTDFFLTCTDPAKHLDLLCKALRERIPTMKKKDGTPMDPLWDVQVLSPQHKGLTGVANLNDAMRSVLNPPRGQGEHRTRAGVLFREGDKVIVNRNMYRAELVNGDVGVVTAATPSDVTARFDGLVSPITYTFERDELANLAPGFACTVHKAQGGESPMVVAVFNSETPPVMRARNLLYTAVTRAKERLWILGNEQTIAQCIANDHPSERKTQLQRMLSPLAVTLAPPARAGMDI